jgi:hypothetical protein
VALQPLFISHGSKDDKVPIEQSIAVVEAMKAGGHSVGGLTSPHYIHFEKIQSFVVQSGTLSQVPTISSTLLQITSQLPFRRGLRSMSIQLEVDMIVTHAYIDENH